MSAIANATASLEGARANAFLRSTAVVEWLKPLLGCPTRRQTFSRQNHSNERISREPGSGEERRLWADRVPKRTGDNICRE